MVHMDVKLEALYRILSLHQPGIIAVSGGVDSSFLAAVAKTWGFDYQTVFLGGPHLSPREQEEAEDLIPNLGLPYVIGKFSPLEVPQAAANGHARCYHCKTALIQTLKKYAHPWRGQVLDGSHQEDATEYRPGRRALEEQGVVSPLAEAEMAKKDIRTQARALGLEQADQPSRPCLMTRFGYGYAMSARELLNVGRAEDELRRIGLNLFRIRFPARGGVLLHIHQSQEDWVRHRQPAITQCMEQAGFSSFSLELVPKLSGYFDQVSPTFT
ncbi:MAG: hypothetical protein R6V55_11120 [Desulfovermiculus sp.]